MRNVVPLFAMICTSLALAACGGGDETPAGTGGFRVVNGVTDTTSLDASISGVSTNSQNIPFDSASQLADISVGSYTTQSTPNGGTAFSVFDVEISFNDVTTVLTYGAESNATQGGFTAVESLAVPNPGLAVVQFVAAAYASQAQLSNPVYTASFTSTLSDAGAPPTTSVQFGESAAAISLVTGTYEIKVTSSPNCVSGQACSTTVTQVFDSGPKGIILPSGGSASVYQLVAVDATSAQQSDYGSSVVLLLLDNDGNSAPLYNGQN